MQFILTINQVKALEWGLNAQQAMLFAVVHNAPTWAETVVIGEKVFYKLSKSKIISELPLLTDKPDTAYRLLKALALVEVIELSSTSAITLVRLTEKGKTWNTSEKYPSKVGKKSEVGSEKSPTDQVTIDQGTRNQENPMFEVFWKLYPKKVGKQDAERAWKKIKKSEVEPIMQALAMHIRSEQWTKDQGKYIPHPSRWLNGRKWEDEISVPAGASKSPANARPPLKEGQFYHPEWDAGQRVICHVDKHDPETGYPRSLF